jgi:transposase
MGRPSIDPELMIRMLIIGYVFAIRSERAICRDLQVSLAYRWFCGLSIEDKIADHSVFSRHERFRESDMFERVVEACIAVGLVGGKGFRSRCEPNRGGRQQAAIDPWLGVEQGARFDRY